VKAVKSAEKLADSAWLQEKVGTIKKVLISCLGSQVSFILPQLSSFQLFFLQVQMT